MFNDPIAAQKFEKLVDRLSPASMVETGTNLGNGTANMAVYGVPVVTVETNAGFRSQALGNLVHSGLNANHSKNQFGWVILHGGGMLIHSFLGSSPDVLDAMLPMLKRPVLFYLDAHWEKDWPLLDELKVIAKHGHSDCGVIIHDCQVPGKDFGFDSYNGQPLNYDYVKEGLAAINPDFDVFYNTEACDGPARRGILYAFPKTKIDEPEHTHTIT